MSTWHYLSFASDAGFLGGCIVRGDDVVEAAKEAHRLGCNPGGEVLGAPVPADLMPKDGYTGRLLQKHEIDECWADCDTLGNIRDREELDIPDSASVCEHRNEAMLTGSVEK